jgi:hypothetical protein
MIPNSRSIAAGGKIAWRQSEARRTPKKQRQLGRGSENAGHVELREGRMPKENDLEGPQDQGGKHGGQAGQLKPPPGPRPGDRDSDVIKKGNKPK